MRSNTILYMYICTYIYLAKWFSICLFFISFSSFSLKDLSSPNQYEAGLALTGLSCFVTPDIARDLANDVLTLVSS